MPTFLLPGPVAVKRGLAAFLVALLMSGCTGAPTESDGSRQSGPGAPSADRDGGSGGASCGEIHQLVRRVRRGYTGRGSPDVSLIPRAPNYIGTPAMPAHSGPWDYLAEVPLVLYGPGHIRARGAVDQRATMADLAPTQARLIGFDPWPRRDGRVLGDALTMRPPAPPRAVVTIVWDGGGNNALEEHPRSWPYLRMMMERGTSFERMTIGSSPSVTPPVHTTLGTGAWPASHGIPALKVRTRDNRYVDPFEGLDPGRIRVGTLADLYDEALGNRPVTGAFGAIDWHLGMIGQGSDWPGGDRDPVVLLNYLADTLSNEAIYTLPAIEDPAALSRYTDALDARDGELDLQWRGHDLVDETVRYASPAHVAYQQHLIERFITATDLGEDPVPDLLYINFKMSDDAGHSWGMTSPETADALRAQDRALGRLVRSLNRTVGRKRWVLMLTADHGQMPYPHESGGWAIAGSELQADANAALDHTDNGIDLVEFVKSAGMYVRRDDLRPNDLVLKDLARWAYGYRAQDNLREGAGIPASYAGDPGDRLFDAALAGRRLGAARCRP
ncbi:MAG: alkaline phosphatase family protein [Actinobacteria bacterium]|nr:alkaline phosphatase family protein [Actinomycetota bacterium]MDQ3533267.1 alkaline phosphatase family protein [Actinomycetota bacterium]